MDDLEVIEVGDKVVCTVGISKVVEYKIKNNLPHDIRDIKVTVDSMKVKVYGKKDQMVKMNNSCADIQTSPSRILRGQTVRMLVKINIPKGYNEKAEYKEGKRILVAPILKFFINGIKEIKAY